jgi:endonuclease III
MTKIQLFPHVREVTKLLGATYKLSRLGNKANPLDELAYVILSSRTSESKYQAVYRAFKQRFPTWTAVADANLAQIATAISLGGVARKKARYLRAIARKVRRDFGRVSLQALEKWSTAKAEAYLCSLPGVGIKAARCVLMYALDRPVFPADIHCLRVMARLGWIDCRAAASREIADSAQRGDRVSAYIADTTQAGIPPKLRHPLHVFLVQHGQTICRPRPNCPECVLRELCPRIGVEQIETSARAHGEET